MEGKVSHSIFVIFVTFFTLNRYFHYFRNFCSLKPIVSVIFGNSGIYFCNFCFRFQNFIEQNLDEPVAGPSGQNLDDALVIDD